MLKIFSIPCTSNIRKQNKVGKKQSLICCYKLNWDCKTHGTVFLCSSCASISAACKHFSGQKGWAGHVCLLALFPTAAAAWQYFEFGQAVFSCHTWPRNMDGTWMEHGWKYLVNYLQIAFFHFWFWFYLSYGKGRHPDPFSFTILWTLCPALHAAMQW